MTNFQEIGRLEFTSSRVPNDIITLSRSTKFIRIVFSGSPNVSSAGIQIRLNGDTGSNYPRRLQTRDGAGTQWQEDTGTSLMNVGVQPATAPCYMWSEIAKTSNGWAGQWGLSGAFDGTTFRIGSITWTSTSNITTITVGSSQNSTWKSGTTIIVYGHD